MTATRAAEGDHGVPATQRPERAAPSRVPYRGLERYTESDDDAALFFGRDSELEVAAANLLAARLTVLYGPTGAGKSSFLRAGLVHRLRSTTATEPSDLGAPGTIVVVLDEWLGDPAAELWRAVASAGPVGEAGAGAELGERSLHDALRGLSEALNVEFLVVMDQFEEYLAAHPPDSGDQFGDELPGLVAARDVPVRFLISLRDDALAGLDRFKGRIPELFDNYLRLDRLGERAAREAIEGPVRHWNSVSPEPVELEEVLVDAVVGELVGRDVALSPAAAPASEARIEPAHLQLVMARVWEAEMEAGSRTLRLTTLEALGGAAAIVRNHVQEAMSALPPRDQKLAAQVVRFLVTPSGAKARHVPGDLADYTGRPEAQVRALLERLSSGELRILRPAPPPPGSSAPAAYEVFHDVLAGPLLDWRRGYERERLEARARLLLRALVAVSAVAISMAIYLLNPGFLNRLELGTVDLRFDVRGENAPPRDMVMVAVDDATLRPYGIALPRALHARLINRVNAGEPRAIAEDVIFGPRNPADRAGDRALIAALERARSRLVLASPLSFSVETVDAKQEVLPGAVLSQPRFFERHDIRAGWSGLPQDDDDEVRRIDYRVEPVEDARSFPTLAAATAALVGAHPADLPSGAERRASGGQSPRTTWIDYRGGSGTFRSISAREVLSGRVSPDAFRGKIVVIGVVAPRTPGFEDAYATSVDDSMAGPEIHANAIATMLDGSDLRDVSRVVDVLLIVALGLVPLVASALRSRLSAAALIVGAAVFFAVAAYLLFASGWIVAAVAPLAALALATLGILLAQAVQSSMRRRAR
jgi:CHASE2 domain-containing sensor protein